MGSSSSNHFKSSDLEMIEISWSFVRDKQILGMKTMVRYLLYYSIIFQILYIYIPLYFYFYRFIKDYLNHQKKLRKCFALQIV